MTGLYRKEKKNKVAGCLYDAPRNASYKTINPQKQCNAVVGGSVCTVVHCVRWVDIYFGALCTVVHCNSIGGSTVCTVVYCNAIGGYLLWCVAHILSLSSVVHHQVCHASLGASAVLTNNHFWLAGPLLPHNNFFNVFAFREILYKMSFS